MIKSSFIYLLGGILGKAIPFLLLPILTRYLTPEEYGTVALFQVLLLFTVPFVGMNLQINISRNFTSMSHAELAQLIGTLVGLLCCSLSIVFLLVSIWAIFCGQMFSVSYGWLLILPIVAAFHIANQFNLTVLRNQERPIAFASLEVSNSLLNFGISIILVVGLNLGWQGRAIGIVCSTFILGLLGLIILRKQKLLVFEIKKCVVMNVLRISLPLIPHALGGIIITLSDRLFIEKMISKEAVGVYVVGYTFGMLVNLFVEAFSRTWAPWFYRQMSENNTDQGRQRIVRYTYFYFGGITILTFVISVVSIRILPVIVDDTYLAASQFILWVACGYAFRGMYTMVFPYLIYAGKTSFLGVATTGTALVNLMLNFLLIRTNGPVGAAQATLFSWVILFFCTWLYTARICPMPWFDFNRGGRWYLFK